MSQTQIFDVSGGVQTATNWVIRQPTEVADANNVRFDKIIGSAVRRLGYTLFLSLATTGNKFPLGFFEAKFTSGVKLFYAYHNSGNTNTILSCYDPVSTTTTVVKSDYPANCKLQFVMNAGELYVAGMTTDTNARQAVINIQGNLTVSTSRNVFGAPKAAFIGENSGALYAMNVELNGTVYPDRAYVSSPQKGAITYVNAAMTNFFDPLAPTNMQIKVDSARYVKVGLAMDVYKAGTNTLMYTITPTSVNTALDTFDFLPYSVTTTGINATTDVFTVADATKFPTGVGVIFSSTGTVPTGLAAGTIYYAINTSSTTFKVATTPANATAGTAVDITDTGTGTVSVGYSYVMSKTDELWLAGRHGDGTPSILWNTDYRQPQTADFIYISAGKVADTAITGWAKSNNRMNIFTKTSMWQYDNANFLPIYEDIGCIAHDTIVNNGTFIIWLDATGKVRARDSSSGTDQIISRAVKNGFLGNLSATNLAQVSAVMYDSNYKLYIGSVNGKNTRLVYNFDMNIWWIETHTRRIVYSINSSISGTRQSYFLDDQGNMFQDETGNLDHTDTIPWYVDYGRLHLIVRSFNRVGVTISATKELQGLYVYGQNVAGSELFVSVPAAQDPSPISLGQLTGSITAIEVPEVMHIEGRDFGIKVSGNQNGDAPVLEGIEIWKKEQQTTFAKE